METINLILFFFVITILPFIVGIGISHQFDRENKKSARRWACFFICLLGVSMFVYSIVHSEYSYKRGQIDYSKGKIKIFPVVHSENGTITDTTYVYDWN